MVSGARGVRRGVASGEVSEAMGSQWAQIKRSAATVNRRGSGTVGVGLNLDGSQLIMVIYANGALDVIMS